MTIRARLAVIALLPLVMIMLPRPGAARDDLRIALLPIFDALPFYVAEADGLFAEHRVEVEGLRVNSAVERDQLMQAGQIDMMLNEMMSTANFNRDRVTVRVVAAARTATGTSPLFRVLAAPRGDIGSVADLEGATVGLSMNTIIEYVTDRLLAAAGVDPASIRKRSVPVIPERFSLLMQGRIDAAVLPDPLAASAMAAGAPLIVDDAAEPRYAMSVLSASVAAIEDRKAAITRFLAAWDEAVARLTAEPDRYRPLVLAKIRVPDNIRDSFAMPSFPRLTVPSEAQWRDVMAWMTARGLLDEPLPYDGTVTAELIRAAAGGR